MLRSPGFQLSVRGLDVHQSIQTCCFFVSKTCRRASMVVVVEDEVRTVTRCNL